MFLDRSMEGQDKKAFLIALKDVIVARGHLRDLQRLRKHLVRIFTACFQRKVIRTFDNLTSIFTAMGVQMHLSLKMS